MEVREARRHVLIEPAAEVGSAKAPGPQQLKRAVNRRSEAVGGQHPHQTQHRPGGRLQTGGVKLLTQRRPIDVEFLQPQHDVGHAMEAHLRGREMFRSEEHTSELQSQSNLVCRLLLEKKKKKKKKTKK